VLKRTLIAGLIYALAGPAQAGDVPVPRPKPPLADIGAAQDDTAPKDVLAAVIPLPRPKPSIETGEQPPLDFDSPEPETKSKAGAPFRSVLEKLDKIQSKIRPRSRWPKAQVAAAKSQCAQLLAGLDIVWRPENAIGGPGGCGSPMPIAVSEIAGVRIYPVATLNCPMAAALHRWIAGELQPAARKSLGTKVTEIVNASSYACRRRNNSRRGKLSEHAKANAFDMSEFRFAKGAVNVKGNYTGLLQSVGLSGRGNFLRAARKGACADFNTVLGPGSDANHKDHFHVDLMPLRPGRFKMCR
jgi:hypothetical protein